MPSPHSKRPRSANKPGAGKSGAIRSDAGVIPTEIRAVREFGEVDDRLSRAGLVRNRRGKQAENVRGARSQSSTPEELRPALPTPRVASNGVEWLDVPGWGKMSWLWHGFSTRHGGMSGSYCADGIPGELNLGFTADDDRATVLSNRRLLAEAITGDASTPLVTIRQIHSGALVVATSVDASGPDGRERSFRGDGLMTDSPGLLLGIQTADCIPVLVADRKRRAVAAFHAGWRGTVKRIVENGIGRMRLEFGSRPEDLVAAIGPGIGACCYAVGEEVLSEFESQFTYAPELFREVYDTDPVRTKYPMLFLTQCAPGHSFLGPGTHLDLIEANRRQLLAAGLKPRSIHFTGGCTGCQPTLFFSHRTSRGHAGRMLSAIGIRGK
jgi:YfiH family protein